MRSFAARAIEFGSSGHFSSLLSAKRRLFELTCLGAELIDRKPLEERMGAAMRIKCQVRHTDHGVFISGIKTEEETELLRRFFCERGQKPVGPPADCQILLFGVSMDQFARLVEGANIEFV